MVLKYHDANGEVQNANLWTKTGNTTGNHQKLASPTHKPGTGTITASSQQTRHSTQKWTDVSPRLCPQICYGTLTLQATSTWNSTCDLVTKNIKKAENEQPKTFWTAKTPRAFKLFQLRGWEAFQDMTDYGLTLQAPVSLDTESAMWIDVNPP